MARIVRPLLGDEAEAQACRLIARFGSLARLHAASREAVAQACDRGDEVADLLDAARAFTLVAAREQLVGKKVETDSAYFRHYLVTRVGTRTEESVLMLYFTASGVYLGEDKVSCGRTAASMIPVRNLVKRALDLNAGRVVLAHNHPSGNVTPSRSDVVATGRVRSVLQALEITLEDHFVVAAGQVASMRALGLF